MQSGFGKRGYLNEDFRLFHIRDQKVLELEYHYHEFNKIVVFISGQVTYLVEGAAYFLRPWDVLLVGHSQVHRPIIDVSEPYERIVLWVNNAFLEQNSAPGSPLLGCFGLAAERGCALLRADGAARVELMRLLAGAEQALGSGEFGHELMASTLFLQFMVCINRMFLGGASADSAAFRRDPKMDEVLAYINANLAGDLSVAALSRRFFLSPSYLMHRFKAQTGYSAHSYIRQKRLMHAAELIRAGQPVLQAGVQSGFGDYSAFLRAFKAMFGCTPSQLQGAERR